MPHAEHHRLHRAGWLRAAVLGANDGILSTSSLLLGVASAQAAHATILLTGVAALAAGAMAMAAGEYVSVSSQADTERADLAVEREALRKDEAGEREELADIYVQRGLTPELAAQVARQLMARDALTAHARDEIGISDIQAARPLQAALASGASFSAGALLPLLVAVAVRGPWLWFAIAAASVALLAALGAIAARTGGASMLRGAVRVTGWGVLAMGITGTVGALFHVPP